MAAATSPNTEKSPAPAHYQLTVNSYDRTATMVIALLIMVGVTVAGLAIVFFANKFTSPVAPIQFVPMEASSPNANQGLADEPEPPGVEEALELSEPQVLDTLDAIAEMSLNEAMLADESVDADADAGKGEGLGDARRFGPGGDGVVERVPRWQRWKILWEPKSISEYAAWLDFYEIRVGVVDPQNNQIHFAYNFSSGSPALQSLKPDEVNQKWIGVIPTDGPMPRLTSQLARDAGISRRGRITLLFFLLREMETILWNKEDAYNKTGHVDNIRQTVFAVLRDGDAFDFEVIDQKYF